MSSRFWPNQASSPLRAEDLPPALHHRRCSDGAGGQGRDRLGKEMRRSPEGAEARREETVRASGAQPLTTLGGHAQSARMCARWQYSVAERDRHLRGAPVSAQWRPLSYDTQLCSQIHRSVYTQQAQTVTRTPITSRGAQISDSKHTQRQLTKKPKGTSQTHGTKNAMICVYMYTVE